MDYIFQLSYMSESLHPFSESELEKMLIRARRHNEAAGVTGILVYNKGVFLQLLEGEESAVHEIYKRICRDRRHHEIHCFFENYSKERMFADWSMAYKNIDLFEPATKIKLQEIVRQFHNVDIVATRDEWQQILKALRDQI